MRLVDAAVVGLRPRMVTIGDSEWHSSECVDPAGNSKRAMSRNSNVADTLTVSMQTHSSGAGLPTLRHWLEKTMSA